MTRKIVIGVGLLIGGYLVLDHATSGGRLLQTATKGATTIFRTLQGRT